MWIDVVADLVLPRRCAGCGAVRAVWCVGCATSLGRPVAVARPGVARAFALGGYTGPARRAVLAYKERGRRELTGVLGAALAAGVAELGGRWLVPVPSRGAAVRRRGGAHMLGLARRCAEVLAMGGHPARLAPALRLGVGARDSVGLDAAARAANLAGRLRTVDAGLPAGASVVLLDDVITTGATAAACTRVLADAGVRVHAVLALTVAGDQEFHIAGRAAYPHTGESGPGT